MRCVVTAGPTFEPLDQVRRLTNFSTGKLGTTLASCLADAGHEVVLLRGATSLHPANPSVNCRITEFSTGADLAQHLKALAAEPVAAIFHTAAVSDFAFGKVWRRDRGGELEEVASGKIPSEAGALLAELQPTPKILARLRAWFPESMIVGWKYEVEGGRPGAIEAGWRQIEVNQTNGCVVNGPAFGDGFGLLVPHAEPQFLPAAPQLFAALSSWMLTFGQPSQSRVD